MVDIKRRERGRRIRGFEERKKASKEHVPLPRAPRCRDPLLAVRLTSAGSFPLALKSRDVGNKTRLGEGRQGKAGQGGSCDLPPTEVLSRSAGAVASPVKRPG